MMLCGFSAPVNPDTLKDGIRLVALDGAPADPIPVNQVIWDPATNTVFAKPDRLLDQQRRYALVVTDAVRDPAGAAVEPEPGVPVCGQETLPDCGRLAEAVTPRRVVGASLFTTLSATAWLERARTALGGVEPLQVPHEVPRGPLHGGEVVAHLGGEFARQICYSLRMSCRPRRFGVDGPGQCGQRSPAELLQFLYQAGVG
jgi:hypothetical protein